MIEAVQHFDDMGTRTAIIPRWLIQACISGAIFEKDLRTFVKTEAGEVQAHDGDWIVRDDSGATSVCRAEDFAAKYSPRR